MKVGREEVEVRKGKNAHSGKTNKMIQEVAKNYHCFEQRNEIGNDWKDGEVMVRWRDELSFGLTGQHQSVGTIFHDLD